MKDTNHMEDQQTLTPDEVLTGRKDKQDEVSIEELLFPQLPEDYFRDKEAAFSFDDRNPIEKTIDKYNCLPVKPIIRKTKIGGDGDPLEDAAKKSAWEIGLKFSF